MNVPLDEVPDLVKFPLPQKGKRKIVLRTPSVDTILRRMGPTGIDTNAMVEDGGENILTSRGKDEAELHEKIREAARLQAESMERLRAAKELEILLSARERVLDEREAKITVRMADAVPGKDISLLEKSLTETRQALEEANGALMEMEQIVTRQRAEIEQIQNNAVELDSDDESTVDSLYAEITDRSLDEQVAFLKERETFIEESENALFEKAQELQEWETRLQQQEHDQSSLPLAAES